MSIGALVGGKMMYIGRRKSLFISIYISMVGISITMYLNFAVIMVGRFLFGLSSGMMSAIIARYVEETVPFTLYAALLPSLTMA